MAHAQKKEKPPYSGYFLTFELGRINKIKESLYYPGEASESFSAMDWTFERREIAFLSLTPGEVCIDAVVLMERMHGTGGTGKLKMRMWAPVMIEKSINPVEIVDAFPAAERLCTAETFRRIPHDEWSRAIDAIKRLRPVVAELLDTLIALRAEQNRLTGNDTKILRLTEQRDAIGLAFDIASLDRKTILREAHLERVQSAQSVLDLLDQEPQQEQDLIRDDQKVFKGLLSKEDMRSAQFDGLGGRKVRVHVYDKKPLETVLGIDLLIYLADYKSYLLLQYKCMEPKSDEEGRTWSYLVDPQLHKQIQAMNNAVNAFTRLPTPSSPSMADWRLSSEAFFFKFCETTRPDARDDALVAGITLGHSHLKQFLQLPDSHGKDGGQRVGYGNCPRYLNNSQFVELARAGWIGCDQRGFSLISQVITEGQRGGKSAMFAVIEGSGAKTSQDRRKRIR
ncbi:MAG: hypothetical protein HHJ16_05675 [Polaromonas sp.]|uniref:hypothetical protein n=1 Tax=Polaromonas sp. TaxID=1869339 RepID=UPI0017BFDF93|nr:hypothetical protein [Polaromonas sp.]NMM09747.1 hypothetical protein [Polaromonas sp.]